MKRQRLAAFACLLPLMAMAVTAWLPGGLDNGFGLLGVSTSTLLPLAVAAGVSTAAFVLWRRVCLPRVVRAVAVLLALYSVTALLYGVSAGVPIRALFSGDSVWEALPLFLQGATVGGLIVLPAALLAAVIQLGTRHPRQGSTEHALYQGVALAATFAIVLAALPQRSNGSIAHSASARAVDDAARRLAIVENSLRAIEEGDRESPRDRWDPGYVVDQAGKDPAALFAWVRENTAWVPYRGMLRGPVGVLMDRRGNSLDRAILLARLLDAAGHTVRLAHGELPRKQALDLLPDLIPRRAAGVTTTGNTDLEPEPDPDTTAVAAQYQLDGDAIQRGTDAREGLVAELVMELQTRVVDQADRLLSLMTPPDADAEWLARYRAALDALRDHWWVQREEGGTWSDLDLLAPAGSTSALVPGQETMAENAVPSGLRHEVAVRVVLERRSNGRLAESRVLEHVLRPSELFGQPVVLQFWPRSLPAELHSDPNSPFGLKSAALEQREWTAALFVGRNMVAQTDIHASANSPAGPAAGNPFGGLGGAIVGLSRESQPSSAPVHELTAAWIEYEIRAPGGPGRSLRRVVFDLLGAAARSGGSLPRLALTDAQQVTRSLSLMMRTEILATAAEIAPEFVTHLAAQSLVGNRDLLRAVTRDEVEPGEAATEQLLANAAPAVTPLYGLALARTEWRRVRDSVFADRVGIFARHRYPAFAGQELVLRDAIDIVANEMGVTLAEPDAFAARLEQGVFDTNAEALLYANARWLGNTAEAFNASQNWIAVTGPGMDAARSLELDADARRAIAQDVERGYSVIAPTAPVQAGSERYIGWWRIDSTTGDTLGVAANGWGQSMSERGVQYNVLVEWAKTFAFEYAFCQAVPQVANQAVAFLQPYRNQLPSWLPPLGQAQDPGKVYSANKKECLIGAMIATGVTATLPLLLIFLRASLARLATRLDPFWRDQRGGIRMPPGWVRGPVRGGPPAPEGPPTPNPPRGQNPLASTGGADPFAQTQGAPAGSPGSPAQAGPGGAGGSDKPYNWLQPFKPGTAPAGKGPFQGDPELRDWLQNNSDHPLSQMLGGRASYLPGGTPALYQQADAAARSAYNAGVNAGLSAQAARQGSYEAYWAYLKQGRGDFAVPLPSGGLQFKKGPGTMKIEAGGTGLGASGDR